MVGKILKYKTYLHSLSENSRDQTPAAHSGNVLNNALPGGLFLSLSQFFKGSSGTAFRKTICVEIFVSSLFLRELKPRQE